MSQAGPSPALHPYPRGQPAGLADVLDRVLDKGLVIAGDIGVQLLDVEVLTIKLRLLLVSADKAEELGIDWWRTDPYLSSEAKGLEEQNRALRERVAELEDRVAALGDGSEASSDDSVAGDEQEGEEEQR